MKLYPPRFLQAVRMTKIPAQDFEIISEHEWGWIVWLKNQNSGRSRRRHCLTRDGDLGPLATKNKRSNQETR